jgi:hypothetical protein
VKTAKSSPESDNKMNDADYVKELHLLYEALIKRVAKLTEKHKALPLNAPLVERRTIETRLSRNEKKLAILIEELGVDRKLIQTKQTAAHVVIPDAVPEIVLPAEELVKAQRVKLLQKVAFA